MSLPASQHHKRHEKRWQRYESRSRATRPRST